MADVDLRGMLTNKIGPLPAWAWGVTAAVGAYAVMAYKGKSKSAAPAGMVRDPVTGEFKSASSTETVDPVTGARKTSSYEASGAGFGGGGVGTPMGYPMPYTSPGDVYVNLPGDQPNMNPAQPVQPSSSVHYPPKTGPGVEPGKTAGGYWFTINNRDDVNFTVERSGGVPKGTWDSMTPGERKAALTAMGWARLIASNPQVDWANKYTYEDWIGTSLYVPRSLATWGFMPEGASLNAPANYTPPIQQTTVATGV